MAEQADSNYATGWMSDVQRAIALLLVGTFALTVIMATGRVVWLGDTPSIVDMAKTLQAALVNMGLIALGFFFGSSMAKVQSDAGQQRIVEKLTSAAPANGNGAAPAVVVAWWSLLTEEERGAIVAAAASDAAVSTFMAAAQTGRAKIEDLNNLVTKGLLTSARAAEIQAV